MLVVLGAAVGAPLRYATDRVIQRRAGTGFPWGTLTVNAAASLILGLTLGADASPELTALVGAGFCGALSTYSTFGLETVQLATRGARAAAVGNVVGSVLACLGAAVIGYAMGHALV